MTFKAMDLDSLGSVLDEMEKAKEERDSSGGGGYIPTAYVPKGNHTLRILQDPAGIPYRTTGCLSFMGEDKRLNRILDPRFHRKGDENFDEVGNKIPKDIVERTWELLKGVNFKTAQAKSIDNATAQNVCLAYIHLISTDQPTDKWKADTVYLAVFPNRFEEQFLGTIGSLRKSMGKELIQSMNPMSSGMPFEIKVVKGTQGSINIIPAFNVSHEAPFEELPDYYSPLSEQFCPAEFNLELFEKWTVHQEDVRERLGLNDEEGDEDDSPAAAAAGGDDSDSKSDGEEQKAEEQKADESKSEEKTEEKAASPSAAEIAAKMLADKKAAEEAAKAEEAAEETYGLDEDQQATARENGLDYKDFAIALGVYKE